MIPLNKEPFAPSVQYGFVRARQLEGTYPGDGKTGTWPITANRILWGWGAPPEKSWPYDTRRWPPTEPKGIDDLAHEHLGRRYQRARSLNECKLVLAFHSPIVGVSISITKSWYDPPKGIIPATRSGKSHDHFISLVGYEDSEQRLIFKNSWGSKWGDGGLGYLSYRTFQRDWREGWFSYIGPMPPSTEPTAKLTVRQWGAKEFGGGVFHAYEIVGPGEDRMAWAFAIQRIGSLEVEELFVKPQHRKKGFGRQLVGLLAELAFRVQQYPRIWVSYVDATAINIAVLEKLLHPLGLHLREAPVRWAPFVFCGSKDGLVSASLHL